MPPIITSRQALKDYILIRLGSPIINIEISDEQLDFAISDTLDNFLPRAYSGVEERYLLMQFDKGVQDYILDYSIEAVLSVNDYQSDLISSNHSDLFSMNQYIAQDIFHGNVSKIDLVTYELYGEFISTMNIIFSRKPTFDFNCISKKLHMFHSPDATAGKILQVYRRVEPLADPATGREATNVYDVRWIKRMAVEKARYQWGVNLMKYSGSVLPNGMSLNSDGIKQTAETEMDKLMIELHDEWENPTDIFLG